MTRVFDRKALTLALAVGLGLMGRASPCLGEPLNDVLRRAYQSNPQIRAEQAAARATDELAPQALANWRPTVTASGDIGWERLYNNTYATSDAFRQTRNPKSAKLTINEYLYRGGRTIAATTVAENKILAARARLMAVESGVLADAATAYLRVLSQREILSITSESERGIAGELAATRRRFEMGERNKTDVSQAETRHAKAVSDRISAEADLAVAEAMYRTLVGDDAQVLNLPAMPDGLPARREAAIALALESNFGVAAAIYDEKAAKAGVSLAKGELLPTVSLQGAAGRDIESSGNESRIDDATVKLVMTMPLYDGGLSYSKIRQARQTHSQFSINLEKARRDAAEAASKSWDVLNLARERMRVNEARQASAETALYNIEREQSFGTRSLIDVLDARQDLLDGRVALIRARQDMYAAAFQLKQAIGEMTAAKLALAETTYEPVAHYDEVHGKWIGSRSSTDKERGNTVAPAADKPLRPPAPLPSDVAPLRPAESTAIPEAPAPPAQEEAPPAQPLPEAQQLPEDQQLPEASAPEPPGEAQAPPQAPTPVGEESVKEATAQDEDASNRAAQDALPQAEPMPEPEPVERQALPLKQEQEQAQAPETPSLEQGEMKMALFGNIKEKSPATTGD